MMVTHFKNICKLCQNAQCGHSHVITQKGVPKGASPRWRFSYSVPTCFKCAHISVWLSLSWLLYIIKISFLKSVRAFIDCPLSTHLLSLLLFPFIIFLRLLSVWNILVICLFIHSFTLLPSVSSSQSDSSLTVWFQLKGQHWTPASTRVRSTWIGAKQIICEWRKKRMDKYSCFYSSHNLASYVS